MFKALFDWLKVKPEPVQETKPVPAPKAEAAPKVENSTWPFPTGEKPAAKPKVVKAAKTAKPKAPAPKAPRKKK